MGRASSRLIVGGIVAHGAQINRAPLPCKCAVCKTLIYESHEQTANCAIKVNALHNADAMQDDSLADS